MQKIILRIAIVVLVLAIGGVAMLRWMPAKPEVDKPADKYKEMMAAQREPLPTVSANSKPSTEESATTRPSGDQSN